jgi:hypothetical protein
MVSKEVTVCCIGYKVYPVTLPAYQIENQCKDIPHAYSYTTDLGYVTLETKVKEIQKQI